MDHRRNIFNRRGARANVRALIVSAQKSGVVYVLSSKLVKSLTRARSPSVNVDILTLVCGIALAFQGIHPHLWIKHESESPR